MDMAEPEALRCLAALAHDTRLQLFKQLLRAEPLGLTPGELMIDRTISPATLSFHLKELMKAGLVLPRRSGKFIHYRVDLAAMNGLVRHLTDQCCADTACQAVETGAAC